MLTKTTRRKRSSMLIRWFVWGGATWEHLIMIEFEMKYTVIVITKIYSFYLDALPRTSWDWAVVSCMFTLFTVAFFFWETVHCCLLCLYCFLWRLRLHLLSVMSFHPNKSKEMFRGLLGKHFCKTLAVLMNHSYQFERLKKGKWPSKLCLNYEMSPYMYYEFDE